MPMCKPFSSCFEAANALPQKMMSVAGLEKEHLDQLCQEVATSSGARLGAQKTCSQCIPLSR